MRRTSIIIVNWNTRALVRECIGSIRRHTRLPHELIVVDNGSTDGSAEELKRLADFHTRLILLPTNRGYAAANNLGIRLASGDAVCLLNSDVLVSRGWLDRLLEVMDRTGAGMVGPSTNRCGGKQRRKLWFGRFPPPAVFRPTRSTDFLCFFCVLIARSTIESIGLLDERFGIGYFEDTDYCRRARAAGIRLMISGKSWVWHEANATFHANGIDADQMLERNRDVYDRKWNLPTPAA